MSKGRTRNSGERYPSGKLKTPATRPGAEIRRIVDLARRKAADPILGTPIGWLRLQNDISDLMVRAAETYATQRRAYDAAQGLAGRSARSSSDLGASPRSGGAQSDSKDVRAIKVFNRTHAGIFERLGDECARKSIDVMDRVIIGLTHPAWAEINTLKAGLMAVGEVNGFMGSSDARYRRAVKGVSVYAVPLNLPSIDNDEQISSITSKI